MSCLSYYFIYIPVLSLPALHYLDMYESLLLIAIYSYQTQNGGRDGVVGVATRNELEVSGFAPRWGQDFLYPSSRPRGSPSFLYND
jgi:hypothetical protein